MDEYTFTQAEKERINELYGNDFNDITPEDALLIGRWESWNALNKSEHQALQDSISAVTAEKLEQSRIQHETAMSNLEDMKNAALARLEVLNGYGQ